MFAATLNASTTTGIADNGYALGLKTGTACTAVTLDQMREACDSIVEDTLGWKTNLTIPQELHLDICLPILNSTSTWTAVASFPWKPHTFTEDLYVGIQELGNYSRWSCYGETDCFGTGTGLFVRCQAETFVSHLRLLLRSAL